MSEDLFTISYDINPSPWFSKFIEIGFSRKKLQIIVDDIISECSNKSHYNSSWQYDKHVDKAIKDHWQEDLGSIRPLLKALQIMIIEQTPPNAQSNWHDSHIASLRTIQNKIAWSTPGFIEAIRYNEIYGG